MNSNYSFIIVIVVLMAMLIGTNIQMAKYREDAQANEAVILEMVATLRGRVHDLTAKVTKAEEDKIRLLGLWKRTVRPYIFTEADEGAE